MDKLTVKKTPKVKSIIDDCVMEDGKQYYKVQYEEDWILKSDLESFSTIIENYKSHIKPQIELLTQIHNGDSSICVLKIGGLSGDFPFKNLGDSLLLEKIKELSKKQNQSFESEDKAESSQCQLVYNCVNSNNKSEVSSPTDIAQTAQLEFFTQTGQPFDHLKYAVGSKSKSRQSFKMYKCSICGADFVHRTHLKIHERIHTGEKKKGNLHVHTKIHTGVRDYVCSFCKRTFVTNAQLCVHERTHTNPNKRCQYSLSKRVFEENKFSTPSFANNIHKNQHQSLFSKISTNISFLSGEDISSKNISTNHSAGNSEEIVQVLMVEK